MKRRFVTDKDGNVVEVEVTQDEYAELAEAFVESLIRERDKKEHKSSERAYNPKGYM